MRGTRWLLLLATFFAPVLMVSAAGPVGTTSSSGSDHPPPEPPNVRLIASDASGVTIELNYEAPQIERLDEPAGRVRVTVRRAVPSARMGYPELPVDRITLGVPHGANVRPRAIPGPSKDIGRYRVVPTPHAEIITDPSGAQVAQPKFVEAPEAYGVRGFRPSALAEVVSDGLMRDRRTVTVEVRPVQWDASTRRLRAYSRITLRVDFVGAPAPARVRSRESEAFTGYFGRHLINDEVARAWRAPAAPTDDIDDAAMPPPPPLVMKLFTSRDSVIRVYGREIADYGVDIAAVSPANLSVTFLGDEAPIYVHGDRDGRFDPDDYVEFLATRPTTPYSRWNVYRLAEGETPGLRVAGVEGAPRNGLATLVPNFRSKIHFEENLTHSLLQTATTSAVSPGDPHHWYEARDHWFWFGVKNGVERNEAELKFPLFDVATTFDLGRIDVMLQGGTPVDHDFILSLNEVKVGRVQWIDQREQSLGRSVRIEDLVDAADGMNTMRLIRVDSNEEDDTDKYPYRASVNYFDLEYTRDFRAAGDVLFAATPPSNKDLETRRRRTLEYSISDFVADDIAIYEHNGKNLVSRLRNVEVEARRLTADTRDRLLAVQAALGQPLSSPATLYTARFQAQDTHDAKYVAVSSDGVVAPDRIELDEPSNLRNPSAGADYILIYHRKFAEAAQRLVAWRRTPGGGDLRAKAIEISDVYDEFSHGMATPWAIKDYLRYVYTNYKAPALSYVTILADATYDLFGVDEELYDDAPEVMGYVPTHYVWTLFGQTASDHWFTTVSGIDPLPDFFLGRIPVETAEEADAAVAKILKYEGRPRNGSWRRQIISVADDDTTLSGDFIFKKSLTEVSQNHTLLGYVTNKIFLEDILNEFEEG
ncbi:MAG: C25 family cysteine peptidase, partial [Candidatus Poribacteria bacterium]